MLPMLAGPLLRGGIVTRDYHWHVMIGATGRAAWRPIWPTAADAAWAAEWYRSNTGQPCVYVKACYAGCLP